MDISDIATRVSSGKSVSREEAETIVRSVARVCKGPIKPGKEAEYAELRKAAGTFGGTANGNSIALVDSLNRDFCGYDFNNVILANPLDGKERMVRCPECHQGISYRAPLFKLEG